MVALEIQPAILISYLDMEDDTSSLVDVSVLTMAKGSLLNKHLSFDLDDNIITLCVTEKREGSGENEKGNAINFIDNLKMTILEVDLESLVEGRREEEEESIMGEEGQKNIMKAEGEKNIDILALVHSCFRQFASDSVEVLNVKSYKECIVLVVQISINNTYDRKVISLNRSRRTSEDSRTELKLGGSLSVFNNKETRTTCTVILSKTKKSEPLIVAIDGSTSRYWIYTVSNLKLNQLSRPRKFILRFTHLTRLLLDSRLSSPPDSLLYIVDNLSKYLHHETIYVIEWRLKI